MKKLFLQSGKLMCGEFPEEPILRGVLGHIQMAEHQAAVSAARDSAIEVVESGAMFVSDCAGGIYWYDAPGDKLVEGQLYDIPEGWTVEIEERMSAGWVPSYNDPDNIGCEEPAEPCYYARLIPITKIIESCIYCSGLGGFSHSRCVHCGGTGKQSNVTPEDGVPESGEKPEDRWGLAGELANIMDDLVMGKLDHSEAKRAILTLFYSKVLSVSPPPQAESVDVLWLKYRRMNWDHEEAENGIITKQGLIELLKELKP